MPDPQRLDLTATPLIYGPPVLGQPVYDQYQWQRAEIVSHLGDSQYLVRITYNNRIVNARIAWLDDRIAKLEPEKESRQGYANVRLAEVQFWQGMVALAVKLLQVVSGKEFRDQRQRVEDACTELRRGVPYSYQVFTGMRNEVGDLGDTILQEAAVLLAMIPNEDGLRDKPSSAMVSFETALDNLTSAGCWEYTPNDPCQDPVGGGVPPPDESDWRSYDWWSDSYGGPPEVDHDTDRPTGGGNRKAEALAAARDLLAAFPTPKEAMDYAARQQTQLSEASAWYHQARIDLAVVQFALTEAEAEKRLLTDKGILQPREVAAWATLWTWGLIPPGTRVWLTYPCGDPAHYAPIIDILGSDYADTPFDGSMFGQPQTPFAFGAAGSAVAFAMFPGWQRNKGPGIGQNKTLIFPGRVESVDNDAGTATIQLVGTRSSANTDIVVQPSLTLHDVNLWQGKGGYTMEPGAWRAGDTAAIARTINQVTGEKIYSLHGWLNNPKYVYAGWSLPVFFSSNWVARLYYPDYPNGVYPYGHTAGMQLLMYLNKDIRYGQESPCFGEEEWEVEIACEALDVTYPFGFNVGDNAFTIAVFFSLKSGRLICHAANVHAVEVFASFEIAPPTNVWLSWASGVRPEDALLGYQVPEVDLELRDAWLSFFAQPAWNNCRLLLGNPPIGWTGRYYTSYAMYGERGGDRRP